MSAPPPVPPAPTAYETLPPLFKHENPTVSANPAKGVLGTLARSIGATSNNRLILKPTQIHTERFEELGYDGLFGRYYRLAQSYLSGDKIGSGMDVASAFRVVGAVRVLFFENIKRTLRGMEPIPLDFEEVTGNALKTLRTLKDIPESLRTELEVFLAILELQYDLEMRNARRSVRNRGKPIRVGVAGGTRRRGQRARRHTRRIR